MALGRGTAARGRPGGTSLPCAPAERPYLFSLLRLAAGAVDEVLWGEPAAFTELRGEVALVGEADIDSDGGDGRLALEEQAFGAFDTLLDDELMRRQANAFFEQSGEVKLAEIDGLGDFFERNVLAEAFVDELHGLADTARGDPHGTGAGLAVAMAVVLSEMDGEAGGQGFGVILSGGAPFGDFIAKGEADPFDKFILATEFHAHFEVGGGYELSAGHGHEGWGE